MTHCYQLLLAVQITWNTYSNHWLYQNSNCWWYWHQQGVRRDVSLIRVDFKGSKRKQNFYCLLISELIHVNKVTYSSRGEALFIKHGKFTKCYITEVSPPLSNYQLLIDPQGREEPCMLLLTHDVMLTGPISSRWEFEKVMPRRHRSSTLHNDLQLWHSFCQTKYLI